MDHLPLWPGAQWTDEDLVPFVARRDYLGIPFLQYLEPYLPLSNYEEVHSVSVDELGRICQSCFFFSLLQEMLDNHFAESNYVMARTDNPANLHISTETLHRDLREWAQRMHGEDNEKRESTNAHLENCYRLMGSMWVWISPRLDSKIRRCQMALFASIQQAAMEAFDLPSWWTPSMQDSNPTQRDVQMMVGHGDWCPYEAMTMWKTFESINSALLLRSMKRRKKDNRHIRCTTNSCELASLRKQDFSCAHAEEDCSCDQMFGLLHESVLLDILNRDETPLVKAIVSRTSDDMQIEIVAGDNSTEYVAISHVWSDGSGNPFANAIRACKLKAIARRVSELATFIRRNTMDDDEVEIHLWLDTLCVPVSPGTGQTLALSRMVDYYRNASCVLVLDQEIQAHTYDEASHMLAGMVIFSSRWMLRLWTLQEAVLASRLFFAFANTFVERSTFINGEVVAKQLGEVPYSSRMVYLDLFIHAERLFNRPGRLVRGRAAFTLPDLFVSIKHRMVTVSSDEPLCLANIFGFAIAVAEERDGHRMSIFWERLCKMGEFGQNMIFNPFPRLRIPGYRWAPATLMNGKLPPRVRVWLYFPEPNDLPLHTNQGLSVSYPGLECLAAGHGTSIRQIFQANDQAGLDTCLIRDKASMRWFYLSWRRYMDDFGGFLNENSCFLIVETTAFNVGSPVEAVLATACDGSTEVVRTMKVGTLWAASSEQAALLTKLEKAVAFSSAEYDTKVNEVSFRMWQTWASTTEAEQWMRGVHDILRRGLFFDVVGWHSEPRRWIVG